MMGATKHQQALARFADMLEYPGPTLADRAEECRALVAAGHPQAGEMLGRFCAFAQANPAARLEEVYTSIFDMEQDTSPYVGYHLFQESYKRSLFMVELKRRYREQGFSFDKRELADHLGVMLRFLAQSKDAGLNRELIREAILPSLARMLTGGENAAARREGIKSYRALLEALQLVLKENLQVSPAGEAADDVQGGGRDV